MDLTDDRMPDFVVIGAQKSATTFLQDRISLHPAVEMPDGETRIFEDPFYTPRAVAALGKEFTRAEALWGIKRPGYLGRPEVPERLHRHLPDAKLLAVLREPVARAFSSYYHLVRHGFLPVADINVAFRNLLDGTWSRYPHADDVLEYGLYGKQLRRYLELYPADRIAVLDQPTLVGRPDESLQRVFRFLGVDDTVQLPPATRASNKGIYAPWRLRWMRTKNRAKFRYSPDLAYRDRKQMKPWEWTFNAVTTGIDRVLLQPFDSGAVPELSPDIRAELQDYYADDAKVLTELLPLWDVTADWLTD